jgi:hypothetical protein
MSFWASLAALVTGLAVLVFGVRLIFGGASGQTGNLVTIGGVLTQFIAAGFFFLYSQNLKQLNVFYEKLIRHQDTMYAIGLATHHLPEARKADAMETVIATLLTRNEPKTPMSPEVTRIIAESMQARRAERQ